jgi:hypothetical protein
MNTNLGNSDIPPIAKEPEFAKETAQDIEEIKNE